MNRRPGEATPRTCHDLLPGETNFDQIEARVAAVTPPPVPGCVEELNDGFWRVRTGIGMNDVTYLRPWQFRFPPNATINAGLRVELRYISGRSSGLWYAFPVSP